MATLSNYLENAIANHVCRGTAFTQPSALYCALFTTNPDFETGSGGTEASGGSYARKSVTFGAASGGACATSAAIEWTAGTDLTAGVGYNGWAVYYALSNGNMLYGDTFGGAKTPASGEKVSCAAGALTFTVT